MVTFTEKVDRVKDQVEEGKAKVDFDLRNREWYVLVKITGR